MSWAVASRRRGRRCEVFVYEPGDSALHRSDAVSKLVWMLAVTATVLTVSSVLPTVALLVLVLAVGLVMGRLPAGRLLRRMAPFLIIGAWLFVLLALVGRRGGEPVVTLGPLSASSADLQFGAALGVRLMVLGAASTVFVLTTEPRRLVSDLTAYLRLPYRAGFAVYAALRFIPQLQAEARTIRHAHAVRADAGSGPVARVTELRRLTIPLLAGAIRRVHTTAIAMDARGFGAYDTRTVLDRNPRHPAGVALAAFQVVLFAAVLGWTIFGGGDGQFLRAPIGGA
ncbi:MAG: hypothetical protein GEV11_19810 [Streptosporangiales bacterium]|nr:hypothetical protein [Streptosporangiales bacterium]